MRIVHTSLALASLALVLVASPVLAEETTATMDSTAVTTPVPSTDTILTAAPTPAPAPMPVVTSAPAPKLGANIQALVAKYKEMLAKKRGQASATGAAAGTGQALGTRLAGVDAECVVEAVDVRDAAVETAWGTFSTAIADALKARHTALVAAWENEDLAARATALKEAWATWKKAHRTAHSELKTDRKEAWTEYKDTMKSECKVNVPAEERLSGDSSGSIAL